MVRIKDEEQARLACANCEFVAPRLHPVRLQRPTGEVVNSLVCHYCFLQLTGIAPATARRPIRRER
jgi:hypothetical protein